MEQKKSLYERLASARMGIAIPDSYDLSMKQMEALFDHVGVYNQNMYEVIATAFTFGFAQGMRCAYHGEVVSHE